MPARERELRVRDGGRLVHAMLFLLLRRNGAVRRGAVRRDDLQRVHLLRLLRQQRRVPARHHNGGVRRVWQPLRVVCKDGGLLLRPVHGLRLQRPDLPERVSRRDRHLPVRGQRGRRSVPLHGDLPGGGRDSTGACRAGTTAIVCGSGGITCVNCAALGETCDIYVYPYACDQTCPSPTRAVPRGPPPRQRSPSLMRAGPATSRMQPRLVRGELCPPAARRSSTVRPTRTRSAQSACSSSTSTLST